MKVHILQRAGTSRVPFKVAIGFHNRAPFKGAISIIGPRALPGALGSKPLKVPSKPYLDPKEPTFLGVP